MRLSDAMLNMLRNPETPTYVLRDALREEECPVHTIYVVSGNTGEYSNKRSWTVAAFLCEQQAIAFVERLHKWVEDNGFKDTTPEDYWEQKYDGTGIKPPDDPKFDADYNGVWYNIWNVPLKVEEVQ